MKRSQFIQSVALGALSVGLGDVFGQYWIQPVGDLWLQWYFLW